MTSCRQERNFWPVLLVILSIPLMLTACNIAGEEKGEGSQAGRGQSGSASSTNVSSEGGRAADAGAEKAGEKPGENSAAKSAGEFAGRSAEAEAKKPIAVQVITVAMHDIAPELNLTGVVGALPDHLVRVTPAVAGKLKKVCVVEGQTVKKGQLIAQLEAAHIKDQLDQAEAAVRSAETGVKQGQEAVAFANDNLERQKNLFQAEVSAKKDIATAQNQLQTAQLQIQSAQAQLQSAKASRSQILTELELTNIRAPIDGVISNRYLNSNDSVDLNAAVVQIVGLESVVVTAALPADSPEQLSIGQHGLIWSESDPQTKYDGTITSISPIVDRASNTIPTQLVCANRAGRLRDGQTVQVAIATKHIARAITIPQSALVPDPSGSGDEMVYVVEADRAHRTAVKCGVVQKGMVQITKGLTPGQKIIAAGAYGLPDGSNVTTVEAK
jgi:RND family efflux transporter MFP subunit